MELFVNNFWKVFLTPLLLGFVLDCVFGDPYRLPHPIRFFGILIQKAEILFNNGKYRLFKGACVTFFLVLGVFIFLYAFLQLLSYNYLLLLVIESVLVFYGIACKSLITECLKVEKMLRNKGVKAARQQLSTIVGRDTCNLSENQIRIACLETLSENLSDGVIAPLFYYAIGGIPLLFAYKMVNTLDSMIGYKNIRFNEFGKVAAKTDDILNLIPARLTALLMVLVSGSWRGFVFIFKFGNKHSSPNAGYPEAALAGILNCRFGGPAYYDGVPVTKPYIGYNEKIVSGKHIFLSCFVNVAVTLVFIAVILFLTVL